MNFIKTIPYSEIDFKFVSDYFDICLKGTCHYNKNLCYFESEYPEYNEETNCYKETFVKIYKLKLIEKLKWIFIQFLFEQCVGYHCTYHNKKRKNYFYMRKPKWFYQKIFNLYYGLKDIK